MQRNSGVQSFGWKVEPGVGHGDCSPQGPDLSFSSDRMRAIPTARL